MTMTTEICQGGAVIITGASQGLGRARAERVAHTLSGVRLMGSVGGSV